jgi:hypothetical protein
MIKKIAPLFFLLLTSCAVHKATFVPAQVSSDKGSAVYVYRASDVSNFMLPPNVDIKNSEGVSIEIGRLNYGEYKLVYLQPGQYVIQLDDIKYYAAGGELSLEVKSDVVHYIRLDASLKFETGVRYKSYNRQYQLVEVESVVALDEISSSSDVDKKPKKKKKNATHAQKSDGALESDDDAHFSTDKTTDPFSRNR